MSDKSIIQKWVQEQRRNRKKGKGGGGSVVVCGGLAIGAIVMTALLVFAFVPLASKNSKKSTSDKSIKIVKPLQDTVTSKEKGVAMAEFLHSDFQATTITFYTEKDCKGESFTIGAQDTVEGWYSLCGRNFPGGRDLQGALKSWKPSGDGEIELHLKCDAESYWASLIPKVDACTNFWNWPNTQGIKLLQTSYLSKNQEKYRHSANATTPLYHVIWSGESSRYMGYQTQANYYGFEVSHNDINGRWTRIMTARQPDDLADQFPTFVAKRHPYSRRYGPFNKADGIVKWLSSVDAPKTEVLVLIDPDNWLTNDLTDIAQKIKKGRGAAQRAWYSGSNLVSQLWKEVCKARCDDPVRATAVPYFVHKDDLAVIAPIWRMYTLMLKERTEVDQGFKIKYAGVQIDWGAEMLAWNFACTHAGVDFDVLPNVQVRDVDPPLRKDRISSVKMIHMGRAWLPKGYEPAEQWRHTEGAAWNYRGVQVWCKCNVTADEIYPWPIPDGVDYQSKITLEYLHKSQQKYGKIQRHPLRPRNYHEPAP
ncbi:hypothetical protein AAMO2058_000995100 [Amorphochlora amoebiformis]